MGGGRSGLIVGGLFLTMVQCAAPWPALADIYRYVDEKGVTHFTNAPVDQRFEVYQKDPEVGGGSRMEKRGPREDRYDAEILRASSSHGVDPALVKAVMKAESDFNPGARSSAGAMGLMQLMPETAERLGVKNPFDPLENLKAGVKHLGVLLRRFGTATLAAAAYNSGERNVEKHGGVPPFEETQGYVRKVLSYYEDYRRAGYGASQDKGPASEPGGIFIVRRSDGLKVYTNTPWNYTGASERSQ